VRAFGDYQNFSWWSDHPRDWRPNDRWPVWFGGRVLDGLVEGIDDHIAEVEGRAVALGCVPWFDSSAVASHLVLGTTESTVARSDAQTALLTDLRPD
jgi:hypothetical protein